ncbi:CHAD domain-containing protein [Sulfurovum sp. zt1-1]|uniref:CHAD domain-containing protein n=1 Tax=Sulfurovum zhangzhouensis TaxID=3019067 RepID=A0ABT7QYM8_9BACT|nr:CHAD domain-containing protein [Sulfurovum zhangzhouensis]MDM5271940.1 CHAD domain-containing protein [Sulfurovum zhangzhouensis]
MAELEIERKFLLLPCRAKKLLNFYKIPYEKVRLEQYYVSTPASPYTRYRKKGDTYYQTIKTGEGMVREEKEFEVSQKEYEEHRSHALGRIITKDRYTFLYQDNTYELDIFKGSLKGLCYLEIEFSDKQSADDYQLPEIFGQLLVREVTFDNAFNNSALSNSDTFPTPKIKHPYIDKQKGLYQITPFLPTHHAIDTMIYQLTYEIKQYQTALQNDAKDIEALHQFRIHVRKLRALLQEFKPFFDPQWMKVHKKVLAKFMEQTNAKRDNDVALADIDTFENKLSPKNKKSLEKLKKSLQKKEEKLETKLSTFMSGEPLSNELLKLSQNSIIHNFYQESANQPLILVAISIINQRIQDIITEGKNLKEKSNKLAYHKLRIQFKKLRYLFELLSPIIPQDKLDDALSHLKKLQTILGEINDLQVQKKELKSFCRNCKNQKQKSLKALRKKMKNKEQKKLASFDKVFDTFKKEKSLYQKLLFL